MYTILITIYKIITIITTQYPINYGVVLACLNLLKYANRFVYVTKEYYRDCRIKLQS